MQLCEFLPSAPNLLWDWSRQIGVNRAICKGAPELTGLKPPWDRDSLATIHRRFAEHQIQLIGLEGDEFDMSRIKLGLSGRDDDLERYCRMLGNMGELGIGLLCYNFMAQIGWARSGGEFPARGGAVATGFRLTDMPATTAQGEVPAERIWENYQYFIRAVMPAAKRAGVRMALHPDDPPLPSLCGIGRIFNSPQAFERAMAIEPCESHAITFCQANFKLMGIDLVQWIRVFGQRGQIAFVHVRDVRGTAENFVETFHDEGPTDMVEMFRAYRDAGFDGLLRCDHVPTMSGEGQEGSEGSGGGEWREGGFVPGYGNLGRLFAIGYFKGILDALGVSYQ